MDLNSSIIQTLAFYDLFDHPLTALEVWQWQWSNSTAALSEAAAVLATDKRIEAKNGFYFLSGRGRIVPMRGQRQVWNDVKMARARRAARFISWLPFIRLAAVCNTVNLGVAQEESDIDFFIVAKNGRLWLARFLTSAVLRVSQLRTHGRRIKDRICLSFFLSDNNLNLKPLSLLSDNSGRPDIYLIYWIIQLTPLINRQTSLEQFWQANVWIKEWLSNASLDNAENYHQIKNWSVLESFRWLLENILGGRLGDWLEEKLFCWQEQRLLRRLAHKINQPDGGVVFNHQIIKLHEQDRRELYRQRWLEKVDQYEKMAQ